MMNVQYNCLTADVFEMIYTSVGWAALQKEQVEIALQNSYLTAVLYDDDKPVAMLRIIGDGSLAFFIKNFVVIPEYQNKGAGKYLLSQTEEYLRNKMPDHWSYIIE